MEDKNLGKKTDLLMEERSLTILFISSLTELRLAKMEVTYCLFSPIMVQYIHSLSVKLTCHLSGTLFLMMGISFFLVFCFLSLFLKNSFFFCFFLLRFLSEKKLKLMWLLCAGIDGVESAGNVPLERAINIAGIRRPLMKNDQPNTIYLKSDQRSPSLPLRTHYYPRPPLPPHRRQQQHKQQQQLGFIRNSNGRHPPRPAPVSINNHLGV